jgi:hypothetical protein
MPRLVASAPSVMPPITDPIREVSELAETARVRWPVSTRRWTIE